MLTCIDFLCARQVSKSYCIPCPVQDGLLLPVVVGQELGLDSEGPHHPAVQVHHLPHRLFILKIIHLIVIRIEEGKIRKKIQRSFPKIKIKCCPPKKTATTFAFSSVCFLFLWLFLICSVLQHLQYWMPRFSTPGVYYASSRALSSTRSPPSMAQIA